jgi:hypothetical protein
MANERNSALSPRSQAGPHFMKTDLATSGSVSMRKKIEAFFGAACV